MSTSVIGSQLDAIRAGLAALPALYPVNVFSGEVSPEEAGPECIAFGNATLSEVAISMGGSREETWAVSGEVRVVQAWAGDTESTIAAARDRVLALLAEIETYLNDTYDGGPLPDANLTDADIQNTYGPEGRICSLGFTFSIRAHKNP
jgi:hypothetical protein